MDVFCNLKCYEVNGEKQEFIGKPYMEVLNHWNRKDFVNIRTPEGNTYTVLARELQAAISNATNTCKI